MTSYKKTYNTIFPLLTIITRKEYLNLWISAFIIIALFLINPLIDKQLIKAENKVISFRESNKHEFDSLMNLYEIQKAQEEFIEDSEKFKKDSLENIIDHKYSTLYHNIKIQRLTNIITEQEYFAKNEEVKQLKSTELTLNNISESQTENTRLSSELYLKAPKERPPPSELTQSVKLYDSLDMIIIFCKWCLLFVLLIDIYNKYESYCVDKLRNKMATKNAESTSTKS